jgi:NADPH-dependent ferric siderophore reductase
MGRVTLGGPDLQGLVVDEPAASVRVLLPRDRGSELVLPDWMGNEFRLPDGGRPVLRTLTPRRVDSDRLELDVDVVIHGSGSAAEWASTAQQGDLAAISGPARGYRVDPEGAAFLLAGDETAIPAISQLVEWLPTGKPVRAEIEVAAPVARMALPARPGLSVNWLDLPLGAPPGEPLVATLRDADLESGTRVWVAGEATSMQRIRRYLFDERGLSHREATVRGYWKYGRSAAGEA